jgi:hypothetical protein
MEIKNKTCAILAHGKSLEELERRIEEFRDFNITWCGMNFFNPSEHIINKIDKEFSLVFDCSTVHNNEHYELSSRVPRLMGFFNKNPKYIYICCRTGKDNLYGLRNKLRLEFNERYKDQIIYVEDLGINPNPFCVSLHLYLASLVKLGAKNIILFGADGGGDNGNSVTSYYDYEEIQRDKEAAGNTSYNMVGDTNNVNGSFEPLMRDSLGFVPKILNCSPNSNYNAFNKITYEELIQLFRKQEL